MYQGSLEKILCTKGVLLLLADVGLGLERGLEGLEAVLVIREVPLQPLLLHGHGL